MTTTENRNLVNVNLKITIFYDLLLGRKTITVIASPSYECLVSVKNELLEVSLIYYIDTGHWVIAFIVI